MTERRAEPVFCSECQNEVKVEAARILNGMILCRKDLRQRGLLARMRARKLPENTNRRSGRVFSSFFTSLAALMLVVGIAFIWKDAAPGAGEAQPHMTSGGAQTTFVQGQGEPQTPARILASNTVYTFGGVALIFASIFTAFFGLLAADSVDLMLDIFDQLKQLNRR